MGLFAKKNSYLGVDIGTASIKLVQLTDDGKKINLDTFGYVDVASDIIHDNTPESKQQLITVLKKLVEKAGVSTTQVIAALPTFAVFTLLINLPKLPAKEMPEAIKWEAKKYIPLPLEDMILDWKMVSEESSEDKKKEGRSLFKKKKDESINSEAITPQSTPVIEGESKIISKKQEHTKVLVTAAPKALVNKYLEVFKGAGLNLLSLETEAFAMARALLGKDKQLTMVVDIGSITTDISIVDNGLPVLNRSIDVGGLTVTKAVAASLNISESRAEQFKRDFGLVLGETKKGIPKTIEASLGPIINEIRYVFDMYRGQSNKGVERILLSGGSAFLPNLPDYFLSLFNVPVYIGNPWDKLTYPDDLKPMLDQIGNRMAVAVGLAMRDI